MSATTTDLVESRPSAADQQVSAWIAEHADELDTTASSMRATDLLELLGSLGTIGIGIPRSLGGEGGSTRDAVAAIASVAESSLTAGYLFWCQRASAELLVATGNPWLQANLLPRLLAGETSGTTDLLTAGRAGHDAGVVATTVGRGELTLRGRSRWASNLRPAGFVLATAARVEPGRTTIVAVPSSADGVFRSPGHALLGMQSAWTASVRLGDVQLSDAWVISDHADLFLARVRPTLLLLQSALAVGVARRALAEVRSTSIAAESRSSLSTRVQSAVADLNRLDGLLADLADRPTDPDDDGKAIRSLAVRLSLVRLATRAVHLESEAAGIDGFRQSSDTARRVREATFLPLIGPTQAELETELEPEPGEAGRSPVGLAA